MTTKTGQQPAFPCEESFYDANGNLHITDRYYGMDTRLLIAKDAMCAMLSNSSMAEVSKADVVALSVEFADALLQKYEEGNE